MKYLDEEEKEIIESFERGEWRPIENFEEEKKKLVEAARNTLKKTKNINFRVTERTLNQLKARASEEGIPYQTLLSSVVHKYLNK